MEINEVKIGDQVTFTHNKKKVTGKVIYRHDDSDNKKAERASLMGHVNVQVMDNNSYPVTVHVSKLKPALKEEMQMEEQLNETVLDLIDHIDSGDNLAAEATLNNILQSRAAEVLDALKVEVASSMFNTQDCAECDEEQVDEALKGNQHKIDANKNGKVDAHDFKLLRKKKGMKEEAGVEESVAGLIGAGVGLAMAARGASRAAKTPLSGPRSGTKNYLKNFAKGMVGMKDKPKPKKNVKEEVEVTEASYSAKMARAGKDIGKPGKMFGKIAKKAARKYGKERGAKIAGAVLAKLRKKGK